MRRELLFLSGPTVLLATLLYLLNAGPGVNVCAWDVGDVVVQFSSDYGTTWVDGTRYEAGLWFATIPVPAEPGAVFTRACWRDDPMTCSAGVQQTLDYGEVPLVTLVRVRRIYESTHAVDVRKLRELYTQGGCGGRVR